MGRVYARAVGLTEELDAAAAAAQAHAADGESVGAILAAEPHPGERTFLCAYEGQAGRTWLAFDGDGRPVTDRGRVRAAVSIAALCEVAEEQAGGGELEELRRRLVGLRLTENPAGIDEAEAAALALEAAIGAPPRLATPEYLDGVAAATRRLELALGSDGESPFTVALQQAVGVVEELARDVESQYKVPLT
jgi:hypothetical protein